MKSSLGSLTIYAGLSPDGGAIHDVIPHQAWTVLYRVDSDFLSPPLVYSCAAEDFDHAVEQCKYDIGDCEIVWACKTDYIDAVWNPDR